MSQVPRVFLFVGRQLVAHKNPQSIQFSVTTRFHYWCDPQRSADRRVIGELLFSLETHDYVAVSRTELRAGVGNDYLVDTIMILGLRFYQSTVVATVMAPVEVASVSNMPSPPPELKPETGGNLCGQFRESAQLHILSSESDEPQAGPSHAVLSCRCSVRPRNPIQGTESEPLAARRLPKKTTTLKSTRRRLSGYNFD